jgi:hypothetical protein
MRMSATFLAVGLAMNVSSQTPPSPPEMRAIAERAYLFAYPIVLMEYTRRGSGEMNRFMNVPAFPDASFRNVIRPNADTLYSSAWLDLSKEPLMMHVPDTHDRFYLMQFMDAWTETFSAPGKRTTGTAEGWFAIVGPGWKGSLPDRAQRIDSPTNMVWLLGRTQTNGASDYENVHAIQRGYILMPFSQYPDGPKTAAPGPPQRRAAPAGGPPPAQVARLTSTEFFDTFARLLINNPPHKGDEPMMKDLARIGIEPGKAFHPESLGADGAKAVDDGVKDATGKLAIADRAVAGHAGKTGWTSFGTKVGRYGTDYEVRAQVARIGLGANPPEDAVYMACGRDAEEHLLDGANQYRLHFEKGQTPPVRAFWSVTMYSEDGYFIPNPVNRFAIGDRDPLKFNEDGSLDLYIQRDAPGGVKDSNWLPAPPARFNLNLRMYWPKDEVLSGSWIPPAVTRGQ